MKLHCTNTASGLVPCYDADFEEKRKLKIGQTYEVEIKLARNYQFLKKYFALIACAWEYQSEKVRAFFGESKEGFRKTVEVAAGWYEPVYDLSKREWVHTPKSISFRTMSAEEFNSLYERVKDVLFTTFLRGISVEEFEKNLINF